MSTIHAGDRPARSPRPALLRWGACLAITTAVLTGATAGVAAAAPDTSADTFKPPPLPACVVSRVTTKPGPRITITVTNHCSKTIFYRIIWGPPARLSDPVCHLLRPGGRQSYSRVGGSTPHAVGCRHR